MKNIIVILSLLLSLNTLAEEKKELTILHTNDTHSCILPWNTNLADTMLAGRGGFLRRITMLKEERKNDPELLYFDSGDFFQGSAFFTLFRGEVEINLMNEMKIDAAALGNHEWDAGMEGLAKLLPQATFPVVCANLDFSGTPLNGIVKPYVVVKRKGLKIGVFGLSPQLEGLVDKGAYGDVKYSDPSACANKTAALLKEKEKCDLVICLSHLGWSETGDKAVIRASKDIDLLLGGHSHTWLKTLEYVENADGRQIPVSQNGKSAVYVGKIMMEITR